jgi:chaperonin cofactor prefoldin
MTQTTVTFSLEDFLIRLEEKIDKRFAELNQKIDKQFADVNQKIDKLTDKVNALEVTVSALSEKVDGMDRRVIKLENTLTIQLWALIGVIVSAVVKFGFFPNP